MVLQLLTLALLVLKLCGVIHIGWFLVLLPAISVYLLIAAVAVAALLFGKAVIRSGR